MTLLVLTNVQRVRDLMSASEALPANASLDTVIGRLVQGVSAEVERYLDRGLNLEARTEQFSPKRFQRTVHLQAYPVAASPAAVVKIASNRDFAAATATATTDYFLDAPRGLVKFDDPLDEGNGTVQVVYTGGLATQAANDAHLPGLEAAYPDIVLGATLWAKVLYDARHRVGASSKGVKGTFIATAGIGHPPPEVKQLLESHRRLRLG